MERAIGGRPRQDIALSRVQVPAGIYAWKREESSRFRARETQTQVRERLVGGFEHGLAAIGYERDAEGNGTYLLGGWDDKTESDRGSEAL